MNAIDIMQSLETFETKCEGCLQYIRVGNIQRRSANHFGAVAQCRCTSDHGPLIVELTTEMIQQGGKSLVHAVLNHATQGAREYAKSERTIKMNITFSDELEEAEYDEYVASRRNDKPVESMSTLEYAAHMKRKRG